MSGGAPLFSRSTTSWVSPEFAGKVSTGRLRLTTLPLGRKTTQSRFYLWRDDGYCVAHPSTPAKPVPRLPGRRFDNYFFTGMAVLMAVTVFAGFAPSYYLAGMFHAPLPSLVVHLHGAMFTAWILLLITQTSLVSAGRVDIHRKLGIAGMFWACLMVVIGVLAATDSLVRADRPGRDPLFFYIIPLSDMLVFAPLIFLAYRARRDRQRTSGSSWSRPST